jgi:beta-phosphoglucomutase-like phosphatase (HAD superfamily)
VRIGLVIFDCGGVHAAASMRVLGYIGGSASDARTLQREGAAAVFDDMSGLPSLLRA